MINVNKMNVCFSSVLRSFLALFFFTLTTASLFAQSFVTIGTGTTYSTTYSPYRGIWEDERQQVLYTAAELSAAGLPANAQITGIAYNVSVKSSTAAYLGYTISLKHTASTSLTTTFESGLTQCFTGSVTTAAGWNQHNFSSNFTWNGTSNLVIQTCFDNAAYTSSDEVYTNTTGSTNQFSCHVADANTGCSLGLPSAYTTRPNIRIYYTASCTPPTTQASSFTTSSVGSASMTVGWTRGSGNSVMVVAKAGSAPTDPANGSSYTANAAYGSGGACGGGFVVYNGTGTSVTVTGLSASTTYYYAIYEYNTTGTCYNMSELSGNQATLCSSPSSQATSLTTGSITSSSITVGWTRGNGNSVLVIAKDATAPTDPTSGTTYTPSATYGSGTFVGGGYAVYSGTGTSVAITGLSASTTYYFAVYELNSTGTCYNLTELTGSATTTCSAPATQATSYGSNTVTSSSMNISWVRGNGNSVLVIAKSGSAATDPSNGVSYTANAGYGLGSSVGGGYVVYNGTGTTVSITGLNPGTTYYYSIYEYNTSGPCYNLTELSGNTATSTDNTTLIIGTSTASTTASPYNGLWHDARSQYIVTAAELTAAGATAGSKLTSLAFNVSSKGSTQAYTGFTIKLAHTSSSSFTSATWLTPTFTTVYSGNYTTTTGWNTHTFSSNFTWDGTSNIVVETCFNNTTYTSNDYVFYTATGSSMTCYNYEDNSTGCSITPLLTTTSRPNMRFGHQGQCTQPSTQANTFTSSSITSNSMTVGWTRGNGNNVLVIAKAGSLPTADPTQETTYTANSVYGSGSTIGGGYVVYNGSGTSVSITGLSSSTTYYFAVYEYNNTRTCYNISELTGLATTTGASTVTIGTGTSTVSNYPYNGLYEDARSQFILLASELSAAGLTANSVITSLAFKVTTKASTQAYTGLTISLGHTSTSSFSSATFLAPSFTTCYSANYTTVTNSWNTHTFTSNFTWDGSSNIVVNVCYNNTSYTSADPVEYTTTAGTTVCYRSVDASTGCSLAASTTSTSRPNIRLGYTLPAPCSGTPATPTAAATPTSVCAGSTTALSLTGYSTSPGISFQWQSSPTGAGSWTNISGATSYNYTATPTANTYYRCINTCANGGASSTSNVVSITLTGATYATLPYSTSFESTWVSGCPSGTRALPDAYWSANPTTGNQSWRRNDDGVAGGGWTSATGAWGPSASAGTYSAQFNSYNSAGSSGYLDLYVNCSALGPKTLAFDFINGDGLGTSDYDSLSLYYSTDAGITFTYLQSISGSFTTWKTRYLSIPSTSAQTVIRFKGLGDGDYNMAIDNLSVTNCSSIPDNDVPCNATYLPINSSLEGTTACADGTQEPSTPSCWTSGNNNTVWYYITPTSTSVKIKTILGTLENTQIAVFSGNCSSLSMVTSACNKDVAQCGYATPTNSELTVTGLTIGATYYIAVDGENSLVGTFNIMVIDGSSSFPEATGQECPTANAVCTNTIKVGNPGYQGIGAYCDDSSQETTNCSGGEKGSAWFTINIAASGNLMFTIIPNDFSAPTTSTDYDFVLWKTSGTGSTTCAAIRSSGGDGEIECNYSAYGLTGMFTSGNAPAPYSSSLNSAFEPPVSVTAGEIYTLVVENFSNSTSGFTIDFSNTAAGIINYNASASTVIWTGGSASTSWTDNVNWGSCNYPNSCTINAVVSPSSTYQPTITAAMGTVSVQNLTIDPGATLTLAAGASLKICGNLTNYGKIIADPTSTLLFKDDLTTHTLNGNFVGSSALGNLRVEDTDGGTNCTVTANQNVEISGTFTTANANSIFNLNSKTLTVGGDFYNENGSSTFTGIGTGSLVFDGSGTQNYHPGGALTLNNVTLDNTGGGLTLDGDLTIGTSGILNMNNGIITTGSAYSVTVNNTSTSSTSKGTTTSYVVGNLTRKIASTGSYDFPVGNTAKGYQRANINFTSATSIGALTARFDSWPSSSSYPPVQGGSENQTTYNLPATDNGYWTISADANGSTGAYTCTLYPNNVTNTGSANGWAIIKQATLNATGWQLVGSASTASSSSAAIRTGMSGFSVYAVAQATKPLPIVLLEFNGKPRSYYNELYWATLSEKNNDYFVLERSNDGVFFSELAVVDGAGTSVLTHKYNSVDDNPFETTYYRLKQVDFDGAYTYSNIISIKRINVDKAFVLKELYPNPANKEVYLDYQAELQSNSISITLTDLSGRIIRKLSGQSSAVGLTTFKLDIDELAQGSYMIHFMDEENSYNVTRKFIKK